MFCKKSVGHIENLSELRATNSAGYQSARDPSCILLNTQKNRATARRSQNHQWKRQEYKSVGRGRDHGSRPRMRSDHLYQQRSRSPSVVLNLTHTMHQPMSFSEMLSRKLNELDQRIFVLKWKNDRKTAKVQKDLEFFRQKRLLKLNLKNVGEKTENRSSYSKIDTLRKLEDETEEPTFDESLRNGFTHSAHAFLKL